MEGIVLDYNANNQQGVARCDAGNRYPFAASDWESHGTPEAGARIDFQCSEGRASHIFRVPSAHAAQPTSAANDPTMSILAVVSLAFAVMGLFSFGSLVAIVCGHIARAHISKSKGEQSGAGIALAGLILGYIGLVWGLFWVILFSVTGLFAALFQLLF